MAKSKIVYIIGSVLIGILSMLCVFTGLIAGGVIDATQTKIVFSSGTSEAVYNGTALTNDTWEIVSGDLKEGHTAKVLITGQQTSVGSSNNHISVTIVDEGGADVTKNYDLEYRIGSLTVTARNIEITADDAQKIYDGTPLDCHTYEVTAGELVEGHTITPSFTSQLQTVGVSANGISATIFDAEGTEVTANYAITFVEGRLTVQKRRIVLQSDNDRKVYDGTVLKNDEWSIEEGSIASGQTATVSNNSEIINVGVVDNEFKITIADANDEDVSQNYDINYLYGKLTVEKFRVEIRTGSASKVYDGETLSSNEWAFVSGTLPTGHTATPAFKNSLTDVGNVKNEATFVINYNNIDVTDNFDIVLTEGELEVTKRPLTVGSGSENKIYDGTPLAGSEEASLQEGTLADGQTIETALTGSQTEAGSSKNSFTVKITDADENDVTDNYAITYRLGDLVVAKRMITVMSDSASKVYDATGLTAQEYEIVDGTVAEGQTHSAVFSKSLTEANEINNEFILSVKDAEDADVTENYQIEYVYGTLTVEKRPMSFRSADGTKNYDGTPLSNANYEVVGGTTVDNQVVTVVNTTQRQNAGSSDNVFDVFIHDADENDVTANYELTLNYGKLNVLPREITISTPTKQKVYDGLPFVPNPDEYEIVSEAKLIEGHTVTLISFRGCDARAGSYKNTVGEITISNADGDDETENYLITYFEGNLVITQRNITVRTGSASKDYDGLPLTYDFWEIVSNTQVVEGQTIGVTVSGVRYEVGESPNTIAEVQILDSDNNDVTSNYNIREQIGALVVRGTVVDPGVEPPAGIDTSGVIQTPGGSAMTPVDVLKVKSDIDGSMYLRVLSYGDYNGKRFLSAAQYTGLLDERFSLNYLTSAALKSSGLESVRAEIESLCTDYPLPYYLDFDYGDYVIQTSDVRSVGVVSQPYSVYYFACDYINEIGLISGGLGEYSDEELAYAAFVAENYLQIPATTKAYLDSVIAEQGFLPTDAEIIKKVAEYIRGAATYNLEYDINMNDAADIVIAFLDIYKEGICQHYASAATMLYRALGIPARRVDGYVTETSSNEWVTVTSDKAHSWVEVYVGGIGWIQVDVTGARSTGEGDNPGDDPIGEDPIDEPTEFDYTIAPIDLYMKYDGINVLRAGTVIRGIGDLLELGYTYDVTISGEQMNVGIGESVIDKSSFILYDINGNDVTSSYRFNFKKGKLHVYLQEIFISSLSAEKMYDGTPLTIAEDAWSLGEESDALISGDTLSVKVEAKEIINVRKIWAVINAKVTDAAGNDVTYMYKITKNPGVLKITPRVVTITSASAEKRFDGVPLIDRSYTVKGDGMAEFDLLTVDIVGSQVNIGRSDNIISDITITNAKGEDMRGNYIITRVNGKLRVRP